MIRPVSKHIKKASSKVRLFGEVRDIVINNRPHKALKAFSGESQEYVVSVIRGFYNWSSCSCDGYYYHKLCKHIHIAETYMEMYENH